ncbi:MAG: hypothetical protein AAF088_04115 [Pseudomonadota bacterium]
MLTRIVGILFNSSIPVTTKKALALMLFSIKPAPGLSLRLPAELPPRNSA